MKRDRRARQVDAALVAASVDEIAEAAGVDTSTVYRWQKVPAKHLSAVSRVTGIAEDRLRPDLFGEEGGRE